MKNSLLIFCLLIFVSPLWAQKTTEKDLQGNWKLVTYVVKGATLDVETGKVTLTDQENHITAAMSGRVKSDMESYAEGLKSSTLEIVGNNFNQVIIDSVKNGSFTITEKDGIEVINAKFDNGKTSEIPFKIIDKKLYLLNFNSPREYIYSKQ